MPHDNQRSAGSTVGGDAPADGSHAAPLSVSRVEWEPMSEGAMRVRIRGRWSSPFRVQSGDPRLLVVQDGVARRIRSTPDAAWATEATDTDEWRAVYALPVARPGAVPNRLSLEFDDAVLELPDPRPVVIAADGLAADAGVEQPTQLSGGVSALRAELEAARETLGAVEGERDTLRSRLHEATLDREALECRLRAAVDQMVSELTGFTAREEARMGELESELSQARADADAALADRARAQERATREIAAAEAARAEVERLSCKLASADERERTAVAKASDAIYSEFASQVAGVVALVSEVKEGMGAVLQGLQAELAAERARTAALDSALAREREGAAEAARVQAAMAATLESEQAMRGEMQRAIAALRSELDELRALASGSDPGLLWRTSEIVSEALAGVAASRQLVALPQGPESGEARAAVDALRSRNGDHATASRTPRAPDLAPHPPADDRAAVRDEVPVAPRVGELAPPIKHPQWIARGLQRLAAQDPALAGRILLALLPAQGAASKGPLRYDLNLLDDGCIAVTVDEAGTTVVDEEAPRASGDTDALLSGEVAALGRLIVSKRRWATARRAGLRINGTRAAHRWLQELAHLPLGRLALAQHGIELDADVLLRLIAASIDPDWTIGHRFVIGVESTETQPPRRWHFHVNGGSAPSVSRTLPLGAADAVLRGKPAELLDALCGAPAPGSDARIAGDPVPLVLVQGWMARLEGGV